MSDPLRLEYRDPATLTPNPKNWRRHPPAQTDALKAALGEVGWAGALLYNETTERLIDGHLRRDLAQGEQVPVLVGSWTEEQERLILATLDPLAAMAQADGDALIALLGSLNVQDRALADMLEALANGERQPVPDDPAAEWQGMPAFEHQDETEGAAFIIRVFLKDADDLAEFSHLLGKDLAGRKFIWFSKQPRPAVHEVW